MSHIHYAESSFKQYVFGQARRSNLGRVTDYDYSVNSWVFIIPSRLMLNYYLSVVCLTVHLPPEII